LRKQLSYGKKAAPAARNCARWREKAVMLLVGLLLVWIVLIPLATVGVLYVAVPRLRRRRGVRYKPRRLRMYGIVLRRIRRSSHNDQFAP
jgi:hypothetical protein